MYGQFAEWELHGKLQSGDNIPKNIADGIIEKLADVCESVILPDLYGCDELICEFTTEFPDDNEKVIEIVSDCSRSVPNAVFMLECDDDEDRMNYRVYIQNGETETVDGHVVYDEPKKIRW